MKGQRRVAIYSHGVNGGRVRTRAGVYSFYDFFDNYDIY